MMKKIFTVLAAVTIALGTVACGSGDSSKGSAGSAAEIAEGNSSKEENSAKDSPAAESVSEESSAAESEKDESRAETEPLDNSTEFEDNNEPTDSAFNKAAAEFSVELLKKACLDDVKAGENAMISPESVMLALGMSANGAGGETLAQYEKLFGGNTESINKNLSSLITASKNSEDVVFNIANSIWVRDSELIKLKQSFAEICKKRLAAESFLVPFDSAAVNSINDWVKKNTNGMIEKIKDDFKADEVSMLINCIAFEGEWLEEYEEDHIRENDTFLNSKGEEEDCTMLYSKETRYISDGKAEGFIKPYKGGRYAFAALLPKEGTELADYIGGLTGEGLIKTFSEPSYEYEVAAYLPEFKVEWGKSITDSVKELGLEKSFDGGADFSNMAETLNGELYIADIAHKTYFELDRKGTKAAAVTAVAFDTNAVEAANNIKFIRLDRPFVCAIIDTETGLPVFIGAVNSLKAGE